MKERSLAWICGEQNMPNHFDFFLYKVTDLMAKGKVFDIIYLDFR